MGQLTGALRWRRTLLSRSINGKKTQRAKQKLEAPFPGKRALNLRRTPGQCGRITMICLRKVFNVTA